MDVFVLLDRTTMSGQSEVTAPSFEMPSLLLYPLAAPSQRLDAQGRAGSWQLFLPSELYLLSFQL